MPIFEYECDDCGLRTEDLYKSSDEAPETIECKECGSFMRKLMSAANHTFAHGDSQMRGPLPPNTGTSDDWNVDKVIGRDAEKKWAAIEERKTHKNGIIRDERKQGRGVETDHLVRTQEGAGDYRVIEEKERKEVNRRRDLGVAVSKAAEKAAQQTPAGE